MTGYGGKALLLVVAGCLPLPLAAVVSQSFQVSLLKSTSVRGLLTISRMIGVKLPWAGLTKPTKGRVCASVA